MIRALLFTLLLLAGGLHGPHLFAAERPNVVLIMTDDQGIGDLSLHGNPVLKTPNIDQIAQSGARMTRFYVSPVCAPTRASLLTGRYYYRTGVVDTYVGRAMMHGDEVTLAEILGKAGYRTGIFGKWHLGDCYPMRPQDQGFQEVLVHRGGGIGQPSDPPGGDHYFDPYLEHNGKLVRQKGYVSDVITDAAMNFIEKADRKPFFVYLPFNAPHTPLEVADSYVEPYLKADLSPENFPKQGFPWKQTQLNATQRVYGMVKNIDDNVGRLLKKLEEKKLRDNTIVIFLTDNGPQQERYKMGFRGLKGSVFEGGIRVPFFLSWPAKIKAGIRVDDQAANIDVVPTLLSLCGVERGEGPPLDGRSFAPVLTQPNTRLVGRTLFAQWHRGDMPEQGRAFAAIGPRYKLVQPLGVQPGSNIKNAPLMLFDLFDDPGEQKDVAQEYPVIVADLKKKYDEWFDSVRKERGFKAPIIGIGSDREPTTTLTRQDWRGPRAGWTPTSIGHWEVEVLKAGPYRIHLWFAPTKQVGSVTIRLNGKAVTREVPAGAKEVILDRVDLPAGTGNLEVEVREGTNVVGVTHAELKRE